MAAEVLCSCISYDVTVRVATPSESQLPGPRVPDYKNAGVSKPNVQDVRNVLFGAGQVLFSPSLPFLYLDEVSMQAD